jgi:uncharacterized protein (DUF488 family)
LSISSNSDANQPRIRTIGHSNHSIDHFLYLLKSHRVDVVVDTRSYPYSNFAPQYDKQPLRQALVESGIKYLHLGRELGGRPHGDEYYDSEGHVLYARVASSDFFRAGISRVERGVLTHSVALLCAEEDPKTCHRRLLIGRVLIQRGIRIDHIRGNGQSQPEEELSLSTNFSCQQMDLFRQIEAPEWKSIPSVLRKNQHKSSSAS